MDKEVKKSDELFVTHALLNENRSEIKSEMTSLRLEMRAGFKSIDAKFEQVGAKFEQVGAKFYSLESQIKSLGSKVHRFHALQEEMRSENRYVLDGYAALKADNIRLENKMDQGFSELKQFIKVSIQEVLKKIES